MTIVHCKCAKCGYSWWPRNEDRPKMCPKCKTKKWEGK
jgi:predicted Zn-ribbon and HTH transcriptional regulator